MENLKHTQGNWEINPVETFYESIGILTPKNKGFTFNEVAQVRFNDRSTKKETEANAKLIASSPELLEALKLALHTLNSCCYNPTVTNQIEAAIKKATL